jgi:hypothetical protein
MQSGRNQQKVAIRVGDQFGMWIGMRGPFSQGFSIMSYMIEMFLGNRPPTPIEITTQDNRG